MAFSLTFLHSAPFILTDRPYEISTLKAARASSPMFYIVSFLYLNPLTSVSVAFVLLQVCAFMIIRRAQNIFSVRSKFYHVSMLLGERGIKERI